MSTESLSAATPQTIRSPWRDFLHAFVRNLLVDLLYAVVNPAIRLRQES